MVKLSFFSTSILIATLSLALCSCATHKQAIQQEKETPPVTTENLLLLIPKGWKLGNETTKGNLQVAKYTPQGETLEKWSKMITVQIIFGGFPGKTIKDNYRDMSKALTRTCQGAKSQLIREQEENGYPSIFWQEFCPKNPKTGMGEITLIKTIQGRDCFYIVQYAWQTPAWGKEALSSPLSESEMIKGAQYLRTATVCDDQQKSSPCPKLK